MDFQTLMNTADRDDGAFEDHLKRILISVTQLPSVFQALKASMAHPDMTTHNDGFQHCWRLGS